MLGRLATRLATFLLQHTHVPERDLLFKEVIDLYRQKALSNEERQILTAMLLERLGALPLRAKITIDKTGMVVVNGRTLDLDTSVVLKQAAAAMKRNAARALVRDTVTFMAIVDGVHKNVNPEMGLFAKAALWFMQEENELYDRLSDGLEDDE